MDCSKREEKRIRKIIYVKNFFLLNTSDNLIYEKRNSNLGEGDGLILWPISLTNVYKYVKILMNKEIAKEQRA